MMTSRMGRSCANRLRRYADSEAAFMFDSEPGTGRLTGAGRRRYRGITAPNREQAVEDTLVAGGFPFWHGPQMVAMRAGRLGTARLRVTVCSSAVDRRLSSPQFVSVAGGVRKLQRGQFRFGPLAWRKTEDIVAEIMPMIAPAELPRNPASSEFRPGIHS